MTEGKKEREKSLELYFVKVIPCSRYIVRISVKNRPAGITKVSIFFFVFQQVVGYCCCCFKLVVDHEKVSKIEAFRKHHFCYS